MNTTEERQWFGDAAELQRSYNLKEQRKINFYRQRQLTFGEVIRLVDRLNAFGALTPKQIVRRAAFEFTL